MEMARPLKGQYYMRDSETKIGLATTICTQPLNGFKYFTYMFDMTSSEVLERYRTEADAVEGHAKWLKWIDLKNIVYW